MSTTEMINNEIKTANETLVDNATKEAFKICGAHLPRDAIMEVITNEEYNSFLTGWLMAKGINTTYLDLTKETNIEK